MDLAHRADGAVGEPFVDEPVALEGHSLVAHLGGDFGLARRLRHRSGLVNRAGQRLLAIDMLAQLDGRDGDDGVRVIRRGDHHGIDALLLVEHLAEVLIPLGGWVLLEGLGGVVPVHVAQGHDVLAADLFEVPGALAADADAGDVKLAVGGACAGAAQHMTRQGHEGGYGAGGGEEVAPGDGSSRLRVHLMLFLHFELRSWVEVIDEQEEPLPPPGRKERSHRDAAKEMRPESAV